MRFFWVKLPYSDDLEVAAYEDQNGVNVWFLTGSDEAFGDEDLIIGTEIHPGKTGLLAALNDVK